MSNGVNGFLGDIPVRVIIKLLILSVAVGFLMSIFGLYPDDILWNFEKFLIGRDGQVVQRFSPDMTPEDPIVMESIKLALAK